MADTTESKVLDIVANIVKSTDTTANSEVPENDEVKSKKIKSQAPRGLPKSGRFWKTKKERFATVNKTKGLRQTFEKKTALRIGLQKTKELSRQKLEELKQNDVERKERRRQNIQRTEENRRKAEVVQVITNTAKLRRMRKKQLRFIEKRDTNKPVASNK